MIERLFFLLVASCMVALDVAIIATLSPVAASVLVALLAAYLLAWLWWRAR